MTTIVIDDKKKGAKEMINLLRTLDYVTSFQTSSKSEAVKMRRQKLIKYPQKYEPPALAGAAEDFPLNLADIRIGWRKK